MADQPPSRLVRHLGVGDAVTIGLGSMIGAGVFAAVGPAAGAAGSGLLVGLALAAALAYCNATSSAALAAVYPASGGTYVYGRERLGEFWGYLAGWGFIVGKTASCAAMALTVGAYAAPSWARPVAVASVVGLAAVNYLGIRKTIVLTRVLLAVVLGALVLAVTGSLAGGTATVDRIGDLGVGGPWGILRSAGILFFAFAGYARIATLGEEVREPARTIPKAIPRALGITLAVYLAVTVAALAAVGPVALAGADAPLVTAVRAGDLRALAPIVQGGAAVAALGVLLSLMVGVSRTAFAMAADGHLPRWLAEVHPDRRVPHRAELAAAVTVCALVALLDLRDAIGFSSFCVLAYYAIANASAWTLPPEQRRWPRALAGAGLAGCVVVAATVPVGSLVAGLGVLTFGALLWLSRNPVSRQMS